VLRCRRRESASTIALTWSGWRCRNLEGVQLGNVAQFVDAPTGPVMVVKDAEGREHWVLATPEYLRKVEVDAGLILVDWPLELE